MQACLCEARVLWTKELETEVLSRGAFRRRGDPVHDYQHESMLIGEAWIATPRYIVARDDVVIFERRLSRMIEN